MATSKVVKRAPRKAAASASTEAQVKVSLEPTFETVPVYANHIEVGHTRHEFTILAGRVPGKMPAERFKQARETGLLQLEPEVTILVAPTLVPGIIRALKLQLEKWEKVNGPVSEPESEKEK
ncbi:MAG: hypothetical protein KIT86_17905 [Hydrogenophaga sp.]|nr:hypothetical protein [Hydrogenophaga sp.]